MCKETSGECSVEEGCDLIYILKDRGLLYLECRRARMEAERLDRKQLHKSSYMNGHLDEAIP